MRMRAEGLRLVRGGATVVDGFSAGFAAGEMSVVLGPNGAGKSSLLMALAGLLRPAAGELLLDGGALAALPPRRRAQQLGYLAQGGELHWNLEAAELVALGRQPHIGPLAGPTEADRAAVQRAMTQADVAQLAGRRVMELSGGERARVLLARVLAGEPRLLLADEPLANLDPRHVEETLALFRAAAAGGAAVVLVLHDLQAAARVADRLLLLAGGRCLADGRPADVLTPALLRQAYDVEMRVRDDPELGLVVIPR